MKKKYMDSSRYSLIEYQGKFFVTRGISGIVLNFLKKKKRKSASYLDISILTGIPRNTLYVYAQRLENTGLLKRELHYCKILSRWITFLTMNDKVKIHKVKIIDR